MNATTKLVFATHNPNKVSEVRALLPNHIALCSLTDMGLTHEISETGSTLEQNARLKSTFIFKNHGVNCFADDTGLLVDALDGAPGVYSARYAGNEKNAEANMDKLLRALDGKNTRSARFETVVSLFWKGEHHYFKGVVSGQITSEKMGVMGFGYDPIFQPDGYDCTFAQLPLGVKNKIGHRGKAMAKLIGFLRHKG